MARITPHWLLLSSALLMVTGCSQAQERPAPIQALEAQGLEVIGEFDAPSGLSGYAGLAGQNPIAVYVTEDGQHALVGSLVNAKGEDVGAQAVKELVMKPMTERSWDKLEVSTWIADGKATAPRVVYTFSDPNCPYCNRFWEAARPWVDSGKVQLRHVMVGVIRQDSANKVAAILAAPSPEAALANNERAFANGGIKPAATVPAAVRKKLDSNQLLMLEMGFQGTPGILFLDAEGLLQRRAGMPRPEDLATVLGPR
ncbi:thiol:disulfide interchange protein DsbG [Lysobacter sp. A286]